MFGFPIKPQPAGREPPKPTKNLLRDQDCAESWPVELITVKWMLVIGRKINLYVT